MEFTQFFYYISYPTFIEYASNATRKGHEEHEEKTMTNPKAQDLGKKDLSQPC
jgi:hypothetical protein